MTDQEGIQLEDKITKRLTKASAKNVIAFIRSYMKACYESDEAHVITIEKETSGKTLAQLRTIFGRWAKEVNTRTGYSIDEIHENWKHQFLSVIYIEMPRESCKEQAKWLDMVVHLTNNKDWAGLKIHFESASLRYASVKQAMEYMNRIDQHYIKAGIPLPPVDKDWRNRL